MNTIKAVLGGKVKSSRLKIMSKLMESTQGSTTKEGQGIPLDNVHRTAWAPRVKEPVGCRKRNEETTQNREKESRATY